MHTAGGNTTRGETAHHKGRTAHRETHPPTCQLRCQPRAMQRPRLNMLSRKHAPAPPACAISLASCLLSKWHFRIESAPRSEAHLEWARAERLGKQRDIPCLAALSCPPRPARLVSRAPRRLLRRVLPSSIYHRGGTMCPGQTCVRLRSAAWQACSPDTDVRGTGQLAIHDCLWQAQSTPRHSA